MKLKILEDRETLELTPEGELVPHRRITYMIEDKGPFLFVCPVKEWDISRFKLEVEMRAKEIKEMEAWEIE